MVVVQQEELKMFIDGSWADSDSGEFFDSINPATREVLARVPKGTSRDVRRAVDSAEKAHIRWRALEPEERAQLVEELGRRIRERVEVFAKIDALDAGHPVRVMRDDVLQAAQKFEEMAGLASQLKGETFPAGDGKIDYTLREPFGVVARIVPFNHPFKFAAESLAAPLVAGNAVVLKPSSYTPLSALELGKECEKVLPPGVVNIVTGRGSTVGAALATHPVIKRIALTGGLETGREIMRLAADTLKYVTLELGGKNPMIVFPDADVEKAADAAVRGMNFTRTAGQSCQSTSRLFLHEDVHDKILDRVAEKMRRIRVGLPLDEATEMGALVSGDQYEKVLRYVKVGIEEGAKLITGGKRPDRDELSRGYFFEPTLFDGVRQDMKIAQEEIFGPFLSVLTWSDYDRLIDEANSVIYGLTANIWTNDLGLAQETARRIEAGYIWINGPRRGSRLPFGGYKQSGIGRQGGLEELLSYTQEKSVMVNFRP